MPHIRPATEADYDLIRQIAHQTWPDTFSAILSPDQIQYMLGWMYSPEAIRAQVQQKGHTFLLAESDAGEPLGYVSYELNYDQKPIVKIHKLYLLPASQGQGIGRMLLDEVAIRAQKANCQILTLNVNRQNRAVGFYEKLGFSITKTENIDIGNGFWMDDYVMEKPL